MRKAMSAWNLCSSTGQQNAMSSSGMTTGANLWRLSEGLAFPVCPSSMGYPSLRVPFLWDIKSDLGDESNKSIRS